MFPRCKSYLHRTAFSAHAREVGFYPGALWHVCEYAETANWSDASEWRARAEARTNCRPRPGGQIASSTEFPESIACPAERDNLSNYSVAPDREDR